MKNTRINRSSERGGAALKLLLFLLVLVVAANGGFHYLKTIYNAASLKQEMYTAVVQATLIPSVNKKPVDVAKSKIQSAMRSHAVPEDAIVEIKLAGKAVEAYISYTEPVPILPFGLYTYEYQFDYTASPDSFVVE